MSLKNKYAETLKLFQCDEVRLVEEIFARILAEREDLRLFFINENECFTDGKNIIIDPASHDLFADRRALKKTEKFLKLDNSISNDPWIALKMATRSPNIHECLHIIYSNFPTGAVTDKRATSRIRTIVLSLINNIIEDAFIEAAGCSVYDNLEHYLIWYRVALCFTSAEVPGTVQKAFKKETRQKEQQEAPEIKAVVDEINHFTIMDYLEYMGTWLLHPFLKIPPPTPELQDYVAKTKGLFSGAAVCGNADKRFGYSQKIFDIVEPLIPDTQDAPIPESLKIILNGIKTHSHENSTLATFNHKGKDAKITRRLFFDENGKLLDADAIKDKIEETIKDFSEEKAVIVSLMGGGASIECHSGQDFDCADIHKNIHIKVNKPAINRNLRQAYKNIENKYRIAINSNASRFAQLLRGVADEREERKYFGNGISSRRLGDIKKRYWYRMEKSEAPPDVSFLFLIDGSGSMDGERRTGAIESLVVLHEVLKANGIEHAIVEHRAIYDEPELEHNILVSFNAKEVEKYNILSLEAYEGTREGLTLYWAEKYLHGKSSSERKVIVMISDGAPCHHSEVSDNYYPPKSLADTALAAKKIINRGIPIIAIALDSSGNDDCYQQLQQIYPNVVSCTDIHKLTGQTLALVSKCFKGEM